MILFGFFQATYDIITDCRPDGASDIEEDSSSGIVGTGNTWPVARNENG
jgi:hypothetical protein